MTDASNYEYWQRLLFDKKVNIPTEAEIGCLSFWDRIKSRKVLEEQLRLFKRDERLKESGRDAAMDDARF